MKKSITLTALVLACSVISAYALLPIGETKYAGSTACKACHNTDKTGKQYAIWEKTPHAGAFKALQTPEADKIAADKGISGKAAEAKECLACHVTGQNVEGAVFDAKFNKEEGVGCEVCHGAGGAYKTLHMKKENLDKAIAAGMQLPKIADGSAEKLCVTCHNDKSPTFKSFKLEDYWAKIAHPTPKG